MATPAPFDLDALAKESGVKPLAPPAPEAPIPGLDEPVDVPAEEPYNARESLGRKKNDFASTVPETADVEASALWGDIRRDLMANGMDKATAGAEASRRVKRFRAVGHTGDIEGVEEALAAREGPLTTGKLATQIVDRVTPLNAPPADSAEGDAMWRATVTAIDMLPLGQAWDFAMKKLDGEPIAEGEAKAAGIDKPLVQRIKDEGMSSLGAAAYAGFSAGLAPTIGSVTGLIPGWSDVSEASGRAMEAAGDYAGDTDVQKAVSPKGLGDLLVRAGINSPLADAIPYALGAVVPDEIEAKHGIDLVAYTKDIVGQMRRSDAFDPAAKALYETGDDAAISMLRAADIPEHIKQVRPDVVVIGGAVQPGGVLADAPELAEFKAGLASGIDPAALQTLADQVPLGILAQAQPDVGPTLDDVLTAYTARTNVQRLTGSEATDKAMGAMAAALMKPQTNAAGERVFVPDTAQKWLTALNFAQPLITEIDVKMAPATWVGEALKLAGSDTVGPMLAELRFPTPAGWESAVATGAYDPLLHPFGLLGSKGKRQRDGVGRYWGRVGADMVHPEFQSFGFQKGARAQGVKPGTTADIAAGTVDFGTDLLVPWEEMLLGPFAEVNTAARRAWIGGKTARGLGHSSEHIARSAMASAMPRLYSGATDSTEALSAALMAGFHDDLRAGRRVFSSGKYGTPEYKKGAMNWKVQREIEQQMKNAGIDPVAVIGAVNKVADLRAAQNLATVKEMLARGGPQDVALRATPEYQATKARVAATGASPEQIDATMALSEWASWNALAKGEVVDAAEWFTGGGTIPPMAADHLLAFLKTADPVHAMPVADAVLGPRWVDDAAQFFDHTTQNGVTTLTAKGEEQFADALARVVRGQLQPHGRADAMLGELKDTLSDLWRGLRNKPVELPAGFREWWDAKLDPAGPLRELVAVSDVRLPRDMNAVRKVVDPATKEAVDQTAWLKKEATKRAGQVRKWMAMELTPGQTQHAFGLATDQVEADALDVAAKAIALVGTTHAARNWGFTGEIAHIGRRSVVPVERKEKVLGGVRTTLEDAVGGPIPADLTFTPAQAAGVKAHVEGLAAAGWAEQLNPELLRPGRDFAKLSEAEWADIAETTADDLAGPGSYRDRAAEEVAGNLAESLLRAAGSAMDDIGVFHILRKKFTTAFDATFEGGKNINPAARDVIDTARRKFGEVPATFARAVMKAKQGAPAAEVEEILRTVQAAIPIPGTAPGDVGDLVRLRKVYGDGVTVQDAIDGATDLRSLFARNPAVNVDQATGERRAVNLLARMKAATPDEVAAASAEIADAVGIVQEGLRRRAAAVEESGTRMGQRMAGKVEIKQDVNDPTFAHDFYVKWHSGDWQGASALIAAKGGASDPLSSYDPLAGALAVVTGLMGDAIMAELARDMMRIGLPIHTDAVTFVGRNFNEWVPLGSPKMGREAHRAAVLKYMNTILTFQGTAANLVDSAGKFIGRQHLKAQLIDGQMNLDAWQDAHRILESWGVKDGTGEMTRLVLPTGEDVFLPEVIAKELAELFERTAKSGLAWTQFAEAVPDKMLGRLGEVVDGELTPNLDRSFVGSAPIGEVLRDKTGRLAVSKLNHIVNVVARTMIDTFGGTLALARVGVTTGVGIPNPAFYIGNTFGGLLQAYQSKGAIETARMLGRYLSLGDNGKLLRSVYVRTFGGSKGFFSPASVSVVDAAGRIVNDEWMTREVLAAGLHTSMPRAESAVKIIDDLRNNAGTFWTRIKRDGAFGGVKETARMWQQYLTDASTAVDDLFRVAVFTDEYLGGASSAEAAAIARRTAFDYGDLTDFEKGHLRRYIMFYTYQRRNADLFWWTMLHHPSRIMGQFRAVRDLQEMAFGDDNTAETVMPEYLAGRAVVALNRAIGDEDQTKGTMGIATLLPPAPAVDHLNLWVDFFHMLNLTPGSGREVLAKLAPEWQAGIVLGLDFDIFSGRDLAAYNTVPAWMVEMDRQMNGGVIVDDLFAVRKTQNKDPSSDAAPGQDRWEPTGGGAKWWWIFRNLIQIPPFGRGGDTITQMARADWLVGGAVNGARWYREAAGLTGAVRDNVADPLIRGLARPAVDILPWTDPPPEPFYEARSPVEDTDAPRAGFTEAQEGRQVFGVKAVKIPTKRQAMDAMEADRQRAIREAAGEQKKADEIRYGR